MLLKSWRRLLLYVNSRHSERWKPTETDPYFLAFSIDRSVPVFVDFDGDDVESLLEHALRVSRYSCSDFAAQRIFDAFGGELSAATLKTFPGTVLDETDRWMNREIAELEKICAALELKATK